MTYRNRRLLDLAHQLHECINCGKFSSHGLEPAHENTQEAGKGVATKSRDNRHSALCHECHAWYDQGTGVDPSGFYNGDRIGKQAMWDRAHKRTFDTYWRRGLIMVSAHV